MSNTNTIPAVLDLGTILKKAGNNIAESPIEFTGKKFNGTAAYLTNPMASKAAFCDTVDGEYDITTVTETFHGATKDEIAVATHAISQRRPEGVSMPISNDPNVSPGTRRVDTGYDWATGQMQITSVPKLEMSLPGFGDHGPGSKFKPSMYVGVDHNNVPFVTATICRGDQPAMQGIFEFIREWADTQSIYLGQVVDQNFNFLKYTDFKVENVAMTDAHREAVNLFVRGPLEFDEANDRLGINPKSGLFLHGDPGGGKTMIMNACIVIAAKMGAAVIVTDPSSGMTGFASANAGMVRLLKAGHKVLSCMEDMEKLAVQSREKALDLLDGGDTKGLRRITIGTTNFIDRIDRAMLRPGRFDSVQFAGLPDLSAFVQLAKLELKDIDTSQIDFEAAFPAFEGYTFAFIANAVSNILRAAVIRTRGETDNLVVTTEDLITSANSVRGHFDLMQTPVEVKPPEMDQLMRDIIAEVVDSQLNERHFSDDVNEDWIVDRVRDGVDSIIEGRLNGASLYDENNDRDIAQIVTN